MLTILVETRDVRGAAYVVHEIDASLERPDGAQDFPRLASRRYHEPRRMASIHAPGAVAGATGRLTHPSATWLRAMCPAPDRPLFVPPWPGQLCVHHAITPARPAPGRPNSVPPGIDLPAPPCIGGPGTQLRRALVAWTPAPPCIGGLDAQLRR